MASPGGDAHRCLPLPELLLQKAFFFSFYLSYISSEISLITFWLNLFLLGRQPGPLLVVRHSAEWDSSHCHHGVQSMNTPKFTPAPHWRHRWPIQKILILHVVGEGIHAQLQDMELLFCIFEHCYVYARANPSVGRQAFLFILPLFLWGFLMSWALPHKISIVLYAPKGHFVLPSTCNICNRDTAFLGFTKLCRPANVICMPLFVFFCAIHLWNFFQLQHKFSSVSFPLYNWNIYFFFNTVK